MATATLTPTGSTRQFEVAYPDSSIPANLTSDWYRSSLNQTSDPDPTRNLARNDWSSLTSELERIAKLGYDWDGEGAEAISNESLKTAASLVRIAEDVTQKVMGQNDALNRLLSTFFGPDVAHSLTTQGSIVSIYSNHPGLEQKKATGLIRDPWDAILAKTNTWSVPGLYPTVEGGVTLKWILRGKELQCTALGDTVEVIRWGSVDSYDSDDLWDLKVDQTREHFEWLMR